MKKTILFIVALIISLPLMASNVSEYHLQNGLTLLVKPDTRAPVMVTQVWYKVGGSYEHNGITGISHALEHMMFRGTKKYGPGKFSALIAENGGLENAATSNDYTFYYEMLSSDKLPMAFELEADRMRNLTLDPAAFAKEIQVVMEERRMRVDDNPEALLYERFMAAANIASPYHHMTIGWMSDLQHMTADDVKQWYHDWYAPNNAIVVVVGDVQPEKVYELAKKYFGPLKSEKLPTLKPKPDVKPLGIREVRVEVPAKLPYLLIGYNVPVVKTAEKEWVPYALDVISGILSGGASSRFARELVRGQEIAASANSYYDPFSLRDDLFIMAAVPSNGHNMKELRKALREQIIKLQTTPVSKQELEQIKAQVIAGHVYEQDSIANQATELGSLAAVGLPWKLAAEYVSNINKITPEQIQAVAKQFLVPNRMTVAMLTPLPLKNGRTTANFELGGGNVH